MEMQFLTCFVICIAGFTQLLRGSEWDVVLEKAKRSEQKVEFFGIVLDQWKQPVKGAEVRYKISSYGILRPSYRTGKAMTDENGKFEIHQGKAAMLYIQDIVLQGYEFSWKTNTKHSFDYDKSYRPESVK